MTNAERESEVRRLMHGMAARAFQGEYFDWSEPHKGWRPITDEVRAKWAKEKESRQ